MTEVKTDFDFLEDALNAYFHQAEDQLVNDKNLGDIQKRNLEEIKVKAKFQMKALPTLQEENKKLREALEKAVEEMKCLLDEVKRHAPGTYRASTIIHNSEQLLNEEKK